MCTARTPKYVPPPAPEPAKQTVTQPQYQAVQARLQGQDGTGRGVRSTILSAGALNSNRRRSLLGAAGVQGRTFANANGSKNVAPGVLTTLLGGATP